MYPNLSLRRVISNESSYGKIGLVEQGIKHKYIFLYIFGNGDLMATPLITQIFETLGTDFGNSIELLKPVAIHLLAWFFAFELLTGLYFSQAGTNPLLVLKSKVQVWVILYILIYYFEILMNLIKDVFQYFTEVATGVAPGRIEDLPYQIITTAYKTLNALLDHVSWRKPSTWALFVGFVVGLFIFARICLTIGMVVLEYMIMSSLVIVLIPFMMFEKLRFVGDKVVGTLINLNMKIFVIQYLMYHFSEFFKEPLMSNKDISYTIENSFYWLTAMAMLALVTLKGSEMAQTLVSGVTTFGDSSELVGMARTGLGRIKGTVSGGITAGVTGKGAIKGAKAGSVDGAVKNSDSSISSTVGFYLGGLKGGIKGGYSSYYNHKHGKKN